MARLTTTANLERPDDIYAGYIALLEGCSDAEVHTRNAKLVLALANHVGDEEVFLDALDLAKGLKPPHELSQSEG